MSDYPAHCCNAEMSRPRCQHGSGAAAGNVKETYSVVKAAEADEWQQLPTSDSELPHLNQLHEPFSTTFRTQRPSITIVCRDISTRQAPHPAHIAQEVHHSLAGMSFIAEILIKYSYNDLGSTTDTPVPSRCMHRLGCTQNRLTCDTGCSTAVRSHHRPHLS